MIMEFFKALCNCMPSWFNASDSGSSQSGESSNSARPTSHQLNDCVFELYKPKGVPSLEILFFHGMQLNDHWQAYWKTWVSGDGTEVWPQTWLADVFPSARILSISYDSSLRRSAVQGRLDLYSIGENLITSIVILANVGQQVLCPVILVGHSFGGIVIKQVCVHAQADVALRSSSDTDAAKIRRFLSNLRGVFYYGTPHHGMPFAHKAAYFLNGPLLDYVKLLSSETAVLNEKFRSLCEMFKCHVAGVGEAHATTLGLFHDVVVPDASAREGNAFSVIAADHISICKPMDRTSNSFLILKMFIHHIVDLVQEEARIENVQRLPKTVGIDYLVQKVLLELQKTTQLGIVGMGGIGKTTLAKAVFNILGPQFDYSCFVPDVKLKTGGFESVMKEVWKHMYYHGKSIDGKKNDWLSLKGKKLLLVLDDISAEEHLEVLAAVAVYCSVGESCFLVTSRNRQLVDVVFEVPLLSLENSRELFISLAFPNEVEPPPYLREHSSQVVEICAGLPLALEVVGKFLRRYKQEEIWKESVQKLKAAENLDGTHEEKLWAKLRLSYDSLEVKEKEVFLDAATVFNDWELSVAKAAWGTVWRSAHSRWETLVSMSLVYRIEVNGKIQMHEHLRALGRKIASESLKEGKCSRVWESQTAYEMLSKDDCIGVEDVVGLHLHWDELKGIDQPSIELFRQTAERALSRMDKLRYIDFEGVRLDGRAVVEGPRTDVALLRWYKLRFANFSFSPAVLKHLAVLLLHDPLELQFLPRSFGQLAGLQILDITSAHNLETLPDEFGRLLRLWRLRCVDCTRLRTLPETLGNLSSLKDVAFSGCSSLGSLPNSFGKLAGIECLDMSGCTNLKWLPQSFGKLGALRHLRLSGCSRLEELPESFGELALIEHLDLSGSRQLEMLPKSFGLLSKLQNLELPDCSRLEELPESFGQLQMLGRLQLSRCEGLVTLPNSLGQLAKLQQLDLRGCKRLKKLPESFGLLLELHWLDCADCTDLEELPESIGRLQKMVFLSLLRCKGLLTLPSSLGQLTKVAILPLFFCRKVESLPESFGGFSLVKELDFTNWHALRTVPDSFGQLSSLEILSFGDCFHLEELPESMGQLRALRYLRISNSPLKRIPDSIKNLRSLKDLQIGQLYAIQTWPSWLGNVTPVRSNLRFEVNDGQFVLTAITSNFDVEDKDDEAVGQLALAQGQLSSSPLAISRTVELVQGENFNHCYLQINCPFAELEMIHLEVQSHDQGFSSHPQDHGTYLNSWTWGEIGILNSEGEQVSKRMRVYTNKHAHKKWQRHLYTVTDETFLRSIEPGFTVALWLRSEFPAWVNFARYASIELVPRQEVSRPFTQEYNVETKVQHEDQHPGGSSSHRPSTEVDPAPHSFSSAIISKTHELVQGQHMNHRYLGIECPFAELETIHVEVHSHDQGFSSYPQDHGTYLNCWTWGEIGIINPEGEEVAPRMTVYTNKHAYKNWQRHLFTLKDEAFLRLIRPGSTIALWLRSAFPEWVNFARYASIELVPRF